MRNAIATILFFMITLMVSGQTILQPDTIIDNRYYKSWCVKQYNTLTLLPSYTIYKVYKPVSKVSRKGMQFKGNNKHFNYSHSGYDKGHLVPAEDMSYSTQSLLSTFQYINCVPQTPKLNRGNWRIEEMKIHKLASLDSLLVITGACDYDSNGIPKYCYKIVQQLSSYKCYLIIYNQEGKEKKVREDKKKYFLEYFRHFLK